LKPEWWGSPLAREETYQEKDILCLENKNINNSDDNKSVKLLYYIRVFANSRNTLIEINNNKNTPKRTNITQLKLKN
jgi:hypothetical protein